MSRITAKQVEAVCRRVSEESVSPEDACNLEGVDARVFLAAADSEHPTNADWAKRLRVAKSSAVREWLRRLDGAKTNGEVKRCELMLSVLDARFMARESGRGHVTVVLSSGGPQKGGFNMDLYEMNRPKELVGGGG